MSLIHWNQKVLEKTLWKRFLVGVATVCIGYIVGLITFVDYYHAGILMVLTFYFFRGRKWWQFVAQLLCLWYINMEMLGGFSYEIQIGGKTYFLVRQGLTLLSLIPIRLYHGKQGYHSKALQYFYYSFYPLHLLLLALLKFLI